MPIILLIRHGENEYVRTGRLPGRLPGIHLNENGRVQTQKIVEGLASIPINAIYSSPLERTMETAELIGRAFQLEVEPREGLIEVDCGEWQGRKISSLRRSRLWKDMQLSPSRFHFPGGETFYGAQQRITKELEVLSQPPDSKDIRICVSHADPIRLAIAFYLSVPLDFFQRLFIAPASITALAIGKTEARLLVLNYEFSFSLPKS